MTGIRTIDALGTHCPVPVRLLADAASKLEPGMRIHLLADDPLVDIDVPAWCHSRGHRIVAARLDGPARTIIIEVGDPSGSRARPAPGQNDRSPAG